MDAYLSTFPIQLALEHRKNINIKAIASNLEQASVVKTSIDDFQIKLQMREVFRDNFASFLFLNSYFAGKIIV